MARRKCVRRAIVELSDSDEKDDSDDCVVVDNAPSSSSSGEKKQNNCNSIELSSDDCDDERSPRTQLANARKGREKSKESTKKSRKIGVKGKAEASNCKEEKSNVSMKKSPAAKRKAETSSSKEEKPKRSLKRKIANKVDDEMGSCVSTNDASSHGEESKLVGIVENGSKRKKLNEKLSIADEGANMCSQAKPKKDDTAETYMARLAASNVVCADWSFVDYIGEENRLTPRVAENVIKLLEDDNTIPFIARYRKDMTQGMDADELRRAKNSYDRAKLIKQKAASIIREIDKQGKWTPEFHAFVNGTKSLNDLDQIHSMFRVTKSTLAEKAKQLGLGPVAEAVLAGLHMAPLSNFVRPNTEGLRTEEQVKNNLVFIIADAINKDRRTFEKIKELRSRHQMHIETTKAKVAAAKKEKTDKQRSEETKYDLYNNFSSSEMQLKPHQILAINRGEARKVLSVKVNVPNAFEYSLKNHCLLQYGTAVAASPVHRTLITAGIEYACAKSIKPSIKRRTRQELNERAEIASMDVFAENVKQLLLTPPVRGKVVVGVDPGFRHGCKLAVVSEQGDVLATETIYPHDFENPTAKREAERTLVRLVVEHRCDVFALGNGTACRETEVFIVGLIKKRAFEPLDVVYTIVDETGASIYSCSPEAKSEFPNLNVNVVSAVSIARRLQDPMAELVKVEPKHLGVGMYQHDLPEKQLAAKLNEVIMEAVSFVGVDVNTASVSLLKRVAGLGESKAKSMIEWRKSTGPFRTRKDLTKVKGIGDKTFEQCAGFIRIMPETAVGSAGNSKKARPEALDYLDQTWIHPESYEIAKKLVKHAECDITNIGTKSFIFAVHHYVEKTGREVLAKKFGTTLENMDVMIKGLTMEKGQDIRAAAGENMFRKSLTSIDDLKIGVILTGVVRNITHFGAFVDVGVETSGLIHKSNMGGTTLSVGQRVETKVMSVEKERNRIGLTLVKCV